MKKTPRKICYMLNHGFAVLFAFALSMALGISGFTQLMNFPKESLSAEVLRIGSLSIGTGSEATSSICYLFIAVSAVLLVSTLLYIRWICNKKVAKVKASS